jgi:phosphatidylglycerophosphatase A
MKKTLVKLIATGLGTGYAPFASGTVGTVPAWFIAYFLIGDNQLALAIISLLSLIVSVWSAGKAEGILGHDSKKIVIDEWAGMFITFLFVPYSLSNYLIAFVMFRALDVIKIYPARRAEKLPGGWGVTTDDVVAGIQSGLATQLTVIVLAKI